jgi:hypothetical protein
MNAQINSILPATRFYPFLPNPTRRKIDWISCGLVSLIFFLFPWTYFSGNRSFGRYGVELAQYAPGLFLIPIGAFLAAMVTHQARGTESRVRVFSAFALLSGLVVLASHLWIINAFDIRNLPPSTYSSEQGIYILPPWVESQEFTYKVLEKENNISIGGSAKIPFFLSLGGSVALIVSALGGVIGQKTSKVNSIEE